MPELTDTEKLKWKTRALDVILLIDRLRDTTRNERELASAIVAALADAVEAELCVLFIIDDEAVDNADLQVRAVIDRAAAYDATAERQLREVARRALSLPQADFLDADVQLKSRRYPKLSCLAAPLRVNDEPLGAIILLNAYRPLNGEERTLVNAAVSQVDSAMQHLRTVRELHRRTAELETIYRIDHVRDQDLPFEEMLTAVLSEVCRTIEAEMGFVMLYDRAGSELELRAATDREVLTSGEAAPLIRDLSEVAIHSGEPVQRVYASGPLRTVIGVPLMLENRLIGVLGVVNRKGQATFTRTDRAMLYAIASQMDTAIFESLQNQKMQVAFGQCVGPQVMKRLLASSDRDLLVCERISVTTLFSDIRGFTAMSEGLPPEVLQAIMNDHLSAMTDLVLEYEGTLDKYIGDCVMAVFNAPERQPDHALRAVKLALEMHAAHHQVMDVWKDRVPLPPIGIGISTGETMMGNFGSVRRLEYTALGKDVNLASRLCGAALSDQTLISQATYDLVKEVVLAEEVTALKLKGIGDDIASWNVLGLR